MLKLHLRPRFESVHLDRLNRDAVKSMFVELSELGLSRNTLKNVLIVARTILNGAIEDAIISVNPAGKLGKFIPRDEDNFEVSAKPSRARTISEGSAAGMPRSACSLSDACPGRDAVGRGPRSEVG